MLKRGVIMKVLGKGNRSEEDIELENLKRAITELEKSRKHLKKCLGILMSLHKLQSTDLSHILELNDQLSASIKKLEKIGDGWYGIKSK